MIYDNKRRLSSKKEILLWLSNLKALSPKSKSEYLFEYGKIKKAIVDNEETHEIKMRLEALPELTYPNLKDAKFSRFTVEYEIGNIISIVKSIGKSIGKSVVEPDVKVLEKAMSE